MRFFPFCVYILIADFIFVAATCSVQYLENSHLNAPVGVGRTSHGNLPWVEALPRNKGNKTLYGEWNDMWINKRYVYSNVPLSQATKKKSKSPGNEDNVSMCF